MTNIPTELLRTLVAVVDLRSFTKAAQSLGVTQPAVSAQIKRLQGMLGAELLDKSAPGVTLTSAGELVVDYARRLLSINDQILDLAAPRPNARTLRIGATGDFTFVDISLALAFFRARRPDLRFLMHSAPNDALLRDLREGNLDLAVWVSATGPTIKTPHHWTEEVVWLRGPASVLAPQGPVPLVSYGEESLFARNALALLRSSGREGELVMTSSSIAGLGAAVVAGLGFMALPRSRANIPGAIIWEDTPLPRLPDIFCGIYMRGGAERADRGQLADAIADALRPRSRADSGPNDVKAATPAA